MDVNEFITKPETVNIVLAVWLCIEQVIAGSNLKSNSTVQLVKNIFGMIVPNVFKKK